MAEDNNSMIPTLPEFPTQWGEEEQKRLDVLEEQKTRMEELYRTKFSPEAWKGVSLPERTLRGLIPGTVFEPIARALTPWQWGFDYGVTPEQVEKRMQETETEYQELLRMQRVVTVLPSIQNTLRLLALSGQTIVTSREELDKYFKLNTLGFSEEEQEYIVNYARSLLQIPDESLISGEDIGLTTITPEELESLVGGDRPILQPNQILSTVALSQDLDQIQTALQQAFPPIMGEFDETVGKERLLEEYIETLKNLGVQVTDDMTLPEMASAAFDIISSGKGWVMPTGDDGQPLIDPQTNEPVMYVIDKDNYAWYGEDIIGYYDESTNNVAPVSLVGEPLTTDAAQESMLKDWGDAAYLSLTRTDYQARQWFHVTIPMMFINQATNVMGTHYGDKPLIEKILSFSLLNWITSKIYGDITGKSLDVRRTEYEENKEVIEEKILAYMKENNYSFEELQRLDNVQQAAIMYEWAIKAGLNVDKETFAYFKLMDNLTQHFAAEYEAREQRYITWLKEEVTEHPELLPREEWTEPMSERWNRDKASILDIGYLGYQVMNNIHTYLAVAASVGVTFLTKNPLIGTGIAIAAFTPMETQSLMEDLMESGASFEMATTIAPVAGAMISSMESLGNVPVLKAFAPQFFTGFKRKIASTLVGKLIHYGLTTPAKIMASETLEEVLQEAAHNAFVMSVDENRHLLENIPETILQTIATTAPLAVLGAGGEYMNMRNYLPEEIEEELESASQGLQDAGIPKDVADLIVYNRFNETGSGRATMDAAVDKMNDDLPTNPQELADHISSLEELLTLTNQGLQEIEDRLPDLQAKLDKVSEIGTREEIKLATDMMNTVNEQKADLEAKRDSLINSLMRARELMVQLNEKPVSDRTMRGTPMPKEVQAQVLREANDLVNTLSPEQRLPRALLVFGIPQGEALVRLDKDGNVLMVAMLHVREETGKLTLDVLVSAQPKTIASSRALRDIMNYLKTKEDLAFPDKSEMSDDALEIYEGAVESGRIIPPPVTEDRPDMGKFPIAWEGIKWGNTIDESRKNLIIEMVNKAISVFDRRIHITEFRIDRRLKRAYAQITTPTGRVRFGDITYISPLNILHEIGHAYSFSFIFEQDFSMIRDFLNHIDERQRVAERLEVDEDKFLNALNQIQARRPNMSEKGAINNAYYTTHHDLEEKFANAFSIYMTKPAGLFDSFFGEYPRLLEFFESRFPLTKAQGLAEEKIFEETPVMERTVKLPRMVRWSDELKATDMALKTHPLIAAKIHFSRIVREARQKAKERWDGMAEDGEKQMELLKSLGLSKGHVGSYFDGMNNWVQYVLTANEIPNGSIHFNMLKEAADMEEFCEYLEESTGLPFLQVYRRASHAKSVADATAEQIIKDLQEEPKFKHILESDIEKAIVAQELNARNEVQGVEHPENITEDQLALVDEIQAIYDLYKPYARYLMFMRTEANMDALKKRFPDAPISELAIGLELRNRQDLDALWQFIQNCTWGVINTGFDPRQMAFSDLQISEVGVGQVLGSQSLNKRTKVEFPEGRLKRDVITRMIHYVTQMEIQWHIEPELRNFEKLWDIAYWKFDNKESVKNVLNRWWGKMQGIPSHYGWFDKAVRRVWRQAMTSVFIEPYMSVRNFFQAVLLHMDRSELVRYIVNPLKPRMKNMGKRYYDVFVSQLGGLRQYMMLVGQPGLPGLGRFNKIADSLNVYGWSDYLPRLWSFNSYLNKAWRATEQYLKDGDIDRWIRNSGALHLRATERNYVLSSFLSRANDMFNLQVDGLETVTGAEMAAFFLAQRNTDRTHFKYRRELRGGMEMGNTGETLWNLAVFPRGYGQRVFYQAEKIAGLFKGETTWQEARGGFNDMLKLFIVAQIFSGFWSGLTGRKRNPYDPFSILTQWTFGGLFVGAMVDLTELLTDIATAMNPMADTDLREQAKGRIPGKVSRLSELLIPFYKRAIDVWASIEGTDDQDVFWMRKLREQLDETYSPEELEKYDMDLWDRMKKAALGTPPPDPTALDKAQTAMQEARDMLGTRDITGKYYTLRDYGNLVASETRDFPDIFTSPYAGSHELDIFYKDCEKQWEEYYFLPSSPSTVRKDWRISHVEEEAMMLFWGKFSASVFPAGSEEWREVSQLLMFWFNLYGIDQTMHPEWANWTLDLTR